jgi:hypothetical protein
MTTPIIRYLFGASIALVLLLTSGPGAWADVIIAHRGQTDPLTENFGPWLFNGGITTVPLPNDNGQAAWQIASSGLPEQQALYDQKGGHGSVLSGGLGAHIAANQ